jgi:hypothetical protein
MATGLTFSDVISSPPDGTLRTSPHAGRRRKGVIWRSAKLPGLFLFAIIASVLPGSVLGQEKSGSPLPDGVVPPPLNVISDEEAEDLESANKMKKRTKLALDFMNTRLLRSESAAEGKKYQESLDQLGRFQALVRHTFEYLKTNEDQKGSIKNFKRFEMTLRGFIPRLELLRRELPYRFGYHVGVTMDYVRKARAQALEPFFEDTVIPGGGNPE